MGLVSMATAPHGSKPAEEMQGGESGMGVGVRSGGVGWGGVVGQGLSYFQIPVLHWS